MRAIEASAWKFENKLSMFEIEFKLDLLERYSFTHC